MKIKDKNKMINSNKIEKMKIKLKKKKKLIVDQNCH